MLSKRKGFTLIELLVVIGIIAVLSSIVIVATNRVRSSARDSKRVFDTQQITTALEAYYARNNFYPTFISTGEVLSDAKTTYLDEVPANPSPKNDGDCSNRDFHYQTDSKGYQLTFCLGENSGLLKKGVNVCVNGNCYSGGGLTVKDSDGNVYGTIGIGGQLWLSENLRSKTKPDGTCINGGGSAPCPDASSADNGQGRTCYAYNEESCASDGALYTWEAVMNGSTAEGAQGLCPTGWHVPSDSDVHILESYLADSGQNCSASRTDEQCNTAGIKLMQGGSSGFNAITAGYHHANQFFNGNQYSDLAYFWTSTANGSDAWLRTILVQVSQQGVRTVQPGVGRSTLPKTDSTTLRCIKNQ